MARRHRNHTKAVTSRHDYIVAGAGLTGATIARLLTDAGYKVLVVERRGQVGGNVYDYAHPSGIRVHAHGPHYFRTSSDAVWSFVSRFGEFYDFCAKVFCRIGDDLVPWPLHEAYIRRLCGERWKPEFRGCPRNFEEAALSMMPRIIYDLFIKEYNEKQWGVHPSRLSPGLCKRFDVRTDGDLRLTPRARYQGIPCEGYHRLVERMLHGIPVLINCDYLAERDWLRPRRKLIYTGAIDAFFDFHHGRLPYRCQRRETVYYADVDDFQGTEQVNEPLHSQGPHIRTIEWKHIMPEAYRSRIRGTVITREFPTDAQDDSEAEYPFPCEEAQEIYRRYRKEAEKYSTITICGRCGEYRYLDMDQAIARAMMIAKRIVSGF